MWNSCLSFRPTTTEGTTIGQATYKNVNLDKIYVGFIKVHKFSSIYAETIMRNLHHYLQLAYNPHNVRDTFIYYKRHGN